MRVKISQFITICNVDEWIINDKLQVNLVGDEQGCKIGHTKKKKKKKKKNEWNQYENSIQNGMYENKEMKSLMRILKPLVTSINTKTMKYYVTRKPP